GQGHTRGHGASRAHLRPRDIRAEAMDGDRPAGISDRGDAVQRRSEDEARSDPVPYRREFTEAVRATLSESRLRRASWLGPENSAGFSRKCTATIRRGNGTRRPS